MNQPYRFLPLVLITLLVACGVSGDGTTNLRPVPPAVRPEAQLPETAEQAETASTPTPWYQHVDLSEVVVRVRPGALPPNRQPETRREFSRAALPHPTPAAYSRRLHTLQQARERLLRENAALTMKLALEPEQPNRELGTLRTRLGRLSAQQRLVMSRTQAIEVEHQALLTLLEQTTARAELGSSN